MAEEKINTGVVDVDSPESVFNELRGEIARITILRDGKTLDRVLPEEIDDDVVFWTKEKYGGGKYQLILFGRDGKVKKRLSFVIDGKPKYPGEDTEKEGGTLKLVEKLIEKLEEKRGGSDQTEVFRLMMEMQKQQFELLLRTVKPEKRESSFVEKFIDKVLSNPTVLIAAGGGLWKLLQKVLTNKNELLELIKVAKADPELKELAIQAVGAKYGTGGGIIDRILSNPELLNRTLEIVNKALTLREAGQNPIPAVKRELRELAGAPRKERTVPGTGGSSPVSNPQSTSQANVENGAEVISVQEVIAIGTKILDMAEKGLNAGQIWDSLSDGEVDVLIAVMEEYSIKDADGLVRFLEGLPVPRFTIAGYIEAIKRHKEVIDELLSFCIAEEVEGSSQEGNQEQLQVSGKAESGQVKRENKGDLPGESQEDYRQVTGEG